MSAAKRQDERFARGKLCEIVSADNQCATVNQIILFSFSFSFLNTEGTAVSDATTVVGTPNPLLQSSSIFRAPTDKRKLVLEAPIDLLVKAVIMMVSASARTAIKRFSQSNYCFDFGFVD